MAKKKTAQARIDADLRSDFDWALEVTGMGETQFIEATIKALVEHVRQKGGIWLPLAIVPKTAAATNFPKVRESGSAGAGDRSSDSTRVTPGALPKPRGNLRLSEEPTTLPKTGPRARSTRGAVAKLAEQEKKERTRS